MAKEATFNQSQYGKWHIRSEETGSFHIDAEKQRVQETPTMVPFGLWFGEREQFS